MFINLEHAKYNITFFSILSTTVNHAVLSSVNIAIMYTYSSYHCFLSYYTCWCATQNKLGSLLLSALPKLQYICSIFLLSTSYLPSQVRCACTLLGIHIYKIIYMRMLNFYICIFNDYPSFSTHPVNMRALLLFK